MTIIITNISNDYINKDYKAIYGNDSVLWFWFQESDLNDAIQIALKQVDKCNRIIIEK